jgi:hypothetical protein
MNTRERIRLIPSLFPGAELGFLGEADVLALVCSELGHEEVLDHPVPLPNGLRMQALAPEEIYHVCASNLDISAVMSLMLGLILGSRLTFKLPGSGLPRFEKLAEKAGQASGLTVDLLDSHDPERMKAADAVVVFGSDATVERLRREVRIGQRFLPYGHRISVGLILPGTGSSIMAEKAASEIIAYEQAGCLSPQAYLCPDFQEAEAFALALAEALEQKEIEQPSPPRGFEEEAMIFEARQRALLRGNRVLGGAEHRPWTVVLRQDGFLEPGPGHRFIQVVPGSDWENILRPWTGKLSALSVSDESLVSSLLPGIRALGFTRVCPLGALQKPKLSWRHDGRPRLADLVTWLTLETV